MVIEFKLLLAIISFIRYWLNPHVTMSMNVYVYTPLLHAAL